jgi:hypothetical protein
LRTRHAHLRLNRTRVGTSTIANAGMGVFATRPIAVQELIALYPGDALLQWHTATDYEDRHHRHGGVRVLFGPHITDKERKDASQHGILFGRTVDAARAYEVRLPNTTLSVVGDPNRCHNDDAAYVGHLLNDGACLTHRDDTQMQELYTRHSLAAANAKIVVGAESCHVELVATKPIAPGQEIFLSYGASYWLSRLPNEEQSQQLALPLLQTSSSSKRDQPLGFVSKTSSSSPRNSKRRKR